MNKYSANLKEEAKKLRMQGKTYREINQIFKTNIPKSTFVTWFKNVPLPRDYPTKVRKILGVHLSEIRKKAIAANKLKRQKFLEELKELNHPIALKIKDKKTAKIALAMLCLGEASKSHSSSSFYLGNSDPKIITLFIELLKYCFKTSGSKFRCTIQCRADQDITKLTEYWHGITNIPLKQFYKPQIDKRSIDKPTKNQNYHGVLRVDYFERKVRFELESLSDLVYNTVAKQD